jgi:hypothetical protein
MDQIIMKPYRVQKKAEMPDPCFTSGQLSNYIQDYQKNSGAVIINFEISQDGTVGEAALTLMQNVKNHFNK